MTEYEEKLLQQTKQRDEDLIKTLKKYESERNLTRKQNWYKPQNLPQWGGLVLVIASIVGFFVSTIILGNEIIQHLDTSMHEGAEIRIELIEKRIELLQQTQKTLITHTNDSELHQSKWQKLEQIREAIQPIKEDTIMRDRKIDSIQTQLKVATDGIREIKESLKQLRNKN